MTDKFNLTFSNDEHELYLFLKSLENGSKTLKDYLKALKDGTIQKTEQSQNTPELNERAIQRLAEITLTDDIKAYGGVSAFLSWNTVQDIKTRISELHAKHPSEADAVVSYITERHPALKRILGEGKP